MTRLEIAVSLISADCTGNGLFDIAQHLRRPDEKGNPQAATAIMDALLVAQALIDADLKFEHSGDGGPLPHCTTCTCSSR